MKYSIAIHGGAGTILKSSMTPEKESAYKSGLMEALTAGEVVLRKGGSSLDAVCTAVACMEDNPLFNAGKGSVFNSNGIHEMDASVMNGQDRSAGAVAGVTGVKNPVRLSRLIMEKTEHVLLIGQGAEDFARKNNMQFENPDYFYDKLRFEQWTSIKDTSGVQLDHSEGKKFGTVGAVAIDRNQHLAAATSTGGMTNKKYGRVGDTPLIGAGTYASDECCAISCTGHGEHFIRHMAAYDVACLMNYKGYSLVKSCETVIHKKLFPAGGEGGLIGVDFQGNIAMIFNSEGMYRACVSEGEEPVVAIYK